MYSVNIILHDNQLIDKQQPTNNKRPYIFSHINFDSEKNSRNLQILCKNVDKFHRFYRLGKIKIRKKGTTRNSTRTASYVKNCKALYFLYVMHMEIVNERSETVS